MHTVTRYKFHRPSLELIEHAAMESEHSGVIAPTGKRIAILDPRDADKLELLITCIKNYHADCAEAVRMSQPHDRLNPLLTPENIELSQDAMIHWTLQTAFVALATTTNTED